MKKNLFLIAFLLVIGYLVFDFFYNRHRISNLHYGVKSNELRKSLHIPIIDNYMKAVNKYNTYFGNRWESGKDLPQKFEILHVWKIVTPLTDSSGLDYEADAFRKRYNDTLFYQLNIYSKVYGDSVVKRNGNLFFYNKRGLLDMELNENQIDSVAENWKLLYLIRQI